MDEQEEVKCLNAAGVVFAIALAVKYDVAPGKVIDILNDFIAFTGIQ